MIGKNRNEILKAMPKYRRKKNNTTEVRIKSIILEATVAIGNISLGKKIFVTSEALDMILPVDAKTALVKNVQGTSATKRKTGYGTPLVGILNSLENIRLKTRRFSNGTKIAQA